MGRTVTLQQISDKARTYADMRGSRFIDDTEMVTLINDAYCELYDELVSASENYFVATTTISIGPGVQMYDLPADFYKILGVDFQVNNGAYITLKPYDEAERNVTLTTNLLLPSGTIRMRYVPLPPTFTALTDTFNGYAGWDRLVSLLVAIDMLDAEESDSNSLKQKYQRALLRIRDMMAPRDMGMPAAVADIYKPNIQYIYGALMYRLYQDQIGFINTEYLGADMFPTFV